MEMIDWTEVFRRLLRYLFEGLAVAVAATYLIKGARVDHVLLVAVTAAAAYAVTDIYAPLVGVSSRVGSGLSIGAQLAAL